jgi:hypothetical protein
VIVSKPETIYVSGYPSLAAAFFANLIVLTESWPSFCGKILQTGEKPVKVAFGSHSLDLH